MKRLITLPLAIGLFAFLGNARHGSLFLSSHDFGHVFVEVNGVCYNDYPASYVSVPRLRPGENYIRVFRRVSRAGRRGFIEREVYAGPIFVDPYSEIHCSIYGPGGFHIDRVRNTRPCQARRPGRQARQGYYYQYNKPQCVRNRPRAHRRRH